MISRAVEISLYAICVVGVAIVTYALVLSWLSLVFGPHEFVVRKVTTQTVTVDKNKVHKCWALRGTPVLNSKFAFESCHLKEKP